jgi:hypothetical protein
VPKLDLVFAISADITSASDTYGFMKRIIKSVITKYGTSSIHYGLLVYGDTPSIKISFHDDQQDPEQLKRLIESTPQSSGGSNLDKALKEVRKMFESRAARVDGIKGLVIMTDRQSDSSVNITETET